jgi:hypothetical protein
VGLNLTKFLEQDIKDSLLVNEDIFGDIGKSAIVFEKAIMRGKTIMDALICTEKKGVIGVEIKTERDTTNRLNKQLHNYEKVCDYVYVLCHDDHVEKVEQILKRYQHTHVGIISYIEFKGKPMLGIYRPTRLSPYKNVFNTLDILWKAELVATYGMFRKPAHAIAKANDLTYRSFKSQTSMPSYERKVIGRDMSKTLVIKSLIKRVGEEGANKLFCDNFIYHRRFSNKVIKIQHFKKGGIK